MCISAWVRDKIGVKWRDRKGLVYRWRYGQRQAQRLARDFGSDYTSRCWPPKLTTAITTDRLTNWRFVGRATADSTGGRTTWKLRFETGGTACWYPQILSLGTRVPSPQRSICFSESWPIEESKTGRKTKVLCVDKKLSAHSIGG